MGRADVSDPFIGQLVDGRWRILDLIGSGGFGVVYRAERIKLAKLVAIKFLDERGMRSREAQARFEREARAISRVQHRHSVSILDFGVHEERPYIVMEYLQGTSLSNLMGKSSMTPMRGVRILAQMLEALKFAHQNNVVHRDLKPDNVMLVEMTGGRDFVKLLDFGLARIISLDEPNISMPHMVAGTPSYMSPEQARGDKTDHRTDIYSAGVLLYGMCTGKKPFRSDDAVEVLRMHMSTPPPSPRKVAPDRNISEALEKVILRALEKKPDDRYLHAAAFLAALKATPEGGASIPDAPRRSPSLRRLLVPAFLIAAGAAGALVGRPWVLEKWAAVRAAVAPKPEPKVEPKVEPVVAAPAPVPAPEPPKPEEPKAEEPKAEEPAKPEEPKQEEAALPSPPAVEAKQAPVTMEDRVAALLEAEKLGEAEKQLRAEQILHPQAAWVHFQLGEIYFRRIWRKDADKEWTTALTLDPSLAHDPRLLRRLCSTLGPGWKGAGEHLIVTKVGAAALAPMTECIRTADDPERVRTAVRMIERTAGRGKVDRALVQSRLAELTRPR